MSSSQPKPRPGQIVWVRQRRYLVEDVVAAPDGLGSTLARLSCVDDDNQGQPLEVLWDDEVDREILTGESWQDLATRGFDPPRLFSAYFHTLRWSCVTATNPRLFQSPFRAGIRIDAYQLEPLRKALLLPRVNLFIADDVGLGKTIEAGLIARELLLRKKVRDIVVACPPSVLPQWQDELETRFGLSFVVLDRDYITRIRQERGYGVNPWCTHTRFLVSHRLLIDEAYTGPLRDWLGDMRPGSLLILDEAHHAAPASGTRYAIDSKITRAIRDLAPRFEHRLFLSATPHNGHSNSFSALLEILDPQRFCRGVPVRGKKLLEDIMVRRLKEDVREVIGGFPRRVVKQIDIDGLSPETPELRLPEMLDQYRTLMEQRLHDAGKRQQAVAGLLLSGLQQRLLSSIEAFARTLRVHRRTVQKRWQQAGTPKPSLLPRPGSLDLLGAGLDSDDERSLFSEETLRAEEDAQVEAATLGLSASRTPAMTEDLFRQEHQLLEEMSQVAEEAAGRPDARIRLLVDWIRQQLCPDLPPLGQTSLNTPPARWNDRRVLIFTEYEDTQRYLSSQLLAAIAGSDRPQERIKVYHGPTPPDEREEIKRAFNTDPKKHPLRILIATDAAREGLNLQSHCWNLFHFDVPWNPSRMEQRNGRLDRKLQPHPEVVCHYFVYRQRVEDRILQALVRKTETIKKELGSLAQVIEGRLTSALQGGIRRQDVFRLEQEITAADLDSRQRQTMLEELEETRERQDDLRGQIDSLRSRLEDARKWIGLKEDHFSSAISCALELMGATPLTPLAADPAVDKGRSRCQFPALDQRDGADPTWVETMDALRTPKRREQKLWQWRRESPIRPVVFEDTGIVNEEVVHLHLEHRVVQRLLGRFSAQGFVHHDLSRACLAQSSDSIPRVVLLGRLCLYGSGAARLHEELVPITARWIDPRLRKGPLTPYKRDAETLTLGLLEEALLRATEAHQVNEVIRGQLQAAAPGDVGDLLQHLEERGVAMAEKAVAELTERGDKEAAAMKLILEDQKKRIEATAAQHRDPQLTFQWDVAEARQLDANRRHWDQRLAAIDQELANEPERIRALYVVRARRIEPVGLVYLWPITG